MKKIAIIGAGPAGLSAAYKLLEHSAEYQIVIFEKESSVGGLSKTFEFEGGRIDIGGHRFFSKDTEVLEVWENLLPYNEQGMLVRDRKSHILWKSKLICYPVQLSFKTIKSLGLFTGVHVVFSYFCSKLRGKNVLTLEDFYVERFGKKLYSLFFKEYTYKLWGIPASGLSADWGEQRIHSVSIGQLFRSALKKNNNETEELRSLVEKYRYPAFGSGQLWQRMADDVIIRGGNIRLDCSVERISIAEMNRISVVYKNHTDEYIEEFDYLISSMPLTDLVNSIDNAPITVKDIASKLHYRDMMIIGLELDVHQMGEAFKEAQTDSWLYIQEPSISFGRVQIVNNWSPYAAKNKDHILLELEYFCNENDDLWNTNDNILVNQAMDELKRCKLCGLTANAISSVVKRIEKAYPIYIDGYYKLDHLRTWLDGITQLQCIGRNGQHKYNNMDHSVMVGFIAAENIITGETDRRRLWSVNEKNENHEKVKAN